MDRHTFSTRIYEADSPFFEGELESLIIPTVDGEYGIQARHRNLVIAIVPGIMKYRPAGAKEFLRASVSEGMVRIEDGDVLILVNTAERPEEIDEERARARAEEAKEIIEEAGMELTDEEMDQVAGGKNTRRSSLFQ